MNDEVQKEKNEGVLEQNQAAAQNQAQSEEEKSKSKVEQQSVENDNTENPAVEATNEGKQEGTPDEPAKEMNGEQFELYNATLRLVSKTASVGLTEKRYNAFEDNEVKRLVKQQVMQGSVPNVQELAASVVERLSTNSNVTEKKAELNSVEESETTKKTKKDDEILFLKAENSLLKAGIRAERIEAAKKLFVAEGADFDKVADFVKKYPEWGAQESRVVFSKADPLADRTAPNHAGQPVLNDFERRVKEIRKKAGLE